MEYDCISPPWIANTIITTCQQNASWSIDLENDNVCEGEQFNQFMPNVA